MGIHAAIAKNKAESCYEPLALKTIQDGYAQTVRAIITNAVGLHRLRNPFEGYRVRWPDNAKPSVKREALDYEKVDKVFKLGVDSGYLDDAMLGPLCLLSSRRIGILPFIRGSDFDRKHGVDIVRVNGIVYDKEKGMYKRIGYKTEGSLRFFVLRDFFRRIGFVDWATEQGDNFIFRLRASTSDPGDVASRRVNRLLKKAGAIGVNIEVAHSLRHGAKDTVIDDVRELRKQIKAWRKIYEPVYGEVRDHLAHNKQGVSEIDPFLAKTNIDEMKRMFGFLHALHEALIEL